MLPRNPAKTTRQAPLRRFYQQAECRPPDHVDAVASTSHRDEEDAASVSLPRPDVIGVREPVWVDTPRRAVGSENDHGLEFEPLAAPDTPEQRFYVIAWRSRQLAPAATIAPICLAVSSRLVGIL